PTGPVLQVLDLDATVGTTLEETTASKELVEPAVPPPAPEQAKPRRFPVVLVGLGIGVGVCVLVTLAILAMWKMFGVANSLQTTAQVASNPTPTISHPTADVQPTGKSNPSTPKTNSTGASPKTNNDSVKPIEPKKVIPDPPAEPNLERREIGRYIPDEKMPSVLVARPSDADGWARLRRDSRVSSGIRLLSLPGYLSPILLDSGAKLTLWGNVPQVSAFPLVLESAAILYLPAKEFDLDFNLDRGRVLLANGKKSGECRIRLRFLHEIWDITLPDEKSEAVAEVWNVSPPDAPDIPEDAGLKPVVCVGLYMKGPAKVRAGSKDIKITKDSQLSWTSLQKQAPEPQPLAALPDWWAKTPDDKFRLALADFHEALGNKSNRMLVDDIVTRLREKRNDPHLEATGILLLGAMDSLPLVIDGLERSDSTVRSATITELRYRLTRGPDQRQKLVQALTDPRAGYSQEKAQLILWLLQGASDAEARRSETYQKLITCLNHEDLPVRDLAYRELQMLAPDIAPSIDYNPAGPEKQRQQAVEQWKQKLPPGKVPDRPKPPDNGL
ncbi:MAG TPA: hypothetical protein VGZ47_11630, partial [Gemmataceae bacterium]|nr:hypothetical protein [Gemmataceae bacterium]